MSMSRMRLRAGADTPDVSIIVPVVERYGNLRQMVAEFSAEIARLGRTQEWIFVVDELQRAVLPQLRELQRESTDEMAIILLGGAFGESAALTVGLERARGTHIVTLAAYFQVEPRGVGAAFAALDAGADMVVGRRYPRIDSRFNRAQSRLFHAIVRGLTSTDFHDISCGFKVMKRQVARELNIYGGLHRFIPVLALNRGFTVHEVPLTQRDEDRSTRYYGTGVYLGRLLDILTIVFLMKFTRMPLRFFGLLGSVPLRPRLPRRPAGRGTEDLPPHRPLQPRRPAPRRAADGIGRADAVARPGGRDHHLHARAANPRVPGRRGDPPPGAAGRRRGPGRLGARQFGRCPPGVVMQGEG